MNQEQAITYLLRVAKSLTPEIAILAGAPLTDVRLHRPFVTAPGAKSHHHAFVGGLVVHTAEVVENLHKLAGSCEHLKRDVLITAAIWHDVGKIHENTIVSESPLVIAATPRRALVGHLVDSVFMFRAYALQHTLFTVDTEFVEDVTHCMLAHHGRREWGSPVEPVTAEAYLLHAADMMSMTAAKS